jgi:hypothetical protein
VNRLSIRLALPGVRRSLFQIISRYRAFLCLATTPPTMQFAQGNSLLALFKLAKALARDPE